MLLVHPLEELLLEITIDRLRVHEVAEPASLAGAFLVLAALSLPEVSDGGVLSHDHAPAVVPPIHSSHSGLSLLFVLELDVEVADHVVADVVGHHELVDLAVLCHLHEHLFVERLKVLYSCNEIFLRHVASVSEGDRSVWVLVHVLEAHCL